MLDDKIELRSEKVRHVIEEVPSRIVRYGITIITFVIFGLLVSVYFIPYPETINVKAQLSTIHQGTIAIPYKYANTIARGMAVTIKVDGYDTQTYGVAHGMIIAISYIPQQMVDGSVLMAQVEITDCRYKIISGMTGKASILISNESVLRKIIKQITLNL